MADCGLTAVDLFAGCGGMSLGFQQAGFDVLAAFEFWNVAADCYAMNFNHPVYRVNLADTDAAVKIIQPMRPNVIIGGPPCQDFSSAGKRSEADRASLTESFAKIVAEVHPVCFVMENVGQARESKAYASARKRLKDAGYGLPEMVLDASLCGVPQKRKRFICFGMLGQEDGFAEADFRAHFAAKPLPLREYFGDSLGFEFYYRHPRNYNRRAVFSIDEPAPTMRGVNRPIPKGYHGHPKDSCPISTNVHVLTTPERALIQTFPKEFQWAGSKTNVEQIIGNAVPVKLAQFVAERVKCAVSNRR